LRFPVTGTTGKLLPREKSKKESKFWVSRNIITGNQENSKNFGKIHVPCKIFTGNTKIGSHYREGELGVHNIHN